MTSRSLFKPLPVATAALVLFGCSVPGDAEISSLENQARELTQRFVGTLLPTLQDALSEGGPAAAIMVCSERAPAIAEELSQESGWSVRRVSLKARNQNNAIPDDWERQALEDFDRRQQSGEAGSGINTSALVAGEFRYMQAQPAMPLCLTCHGENLSQEVRSALLEHYPQDTATGYSAGEIRGAITLRKPVR